VADAEALKETFEYGQLLQTECDTVHESSENRRLLEEAFSLLAYRDLETSPMAMLLSPVQREHLAAALNSAILESQQLPKQAALETLVRQAHSCLEAGREHGLGAAVFVSLTDYC